MEAISHILDLSHCTRCINSQEGKATPATLIYSSVALQCQAGMGKQLLWEMLIKAAFQPSTLAYIGHTRCMGGLTWGVRGEG